MNHDDEPRDRSAALAQVLEDTEGCRAVVASMFLLDLPDDVVDQVATCDEQLTALVVAVSRHLGLGPGRDQGRHAA
jgi:hypothetical protein